MVPCTATIKCTLTGADGQPVRHADFASSADANSWNKIYNATREGAQPELKASKIAQDLLEHGKQIPQDKIDSIVEAEAENQHSGRPSLSMRKAPANTVAAVMADKQRAADIQVNRVRVRAAQDEASRAAVSKLLSRHGDTAERYLLIETEEFNDLVKDGGYRDNTNLVDSADYKVDPDSRTVKVTIHSAAMGARIRAEDDKWNANVGKGFVSEALDPFNGNIFDDTDLTLKTDNVLFKGTGFDSNGRRTYEYEIPIDDSYVRAKTVLTTGSKTTAEDSAKALRIVMEGRRSPDSLDFVDDEDGTGFIAHDVYTNRKAHYRFDKNHPGVAYVSGDAHKEPIKMDLTGKVDDYDFSYALDMVDTKMGIDTM